MNRTELLTAYRERKRDAKIEMLLELAHKLTIVARGTYAQGEIQNAAQMIRVNEFQHRLLRMALDVLCGQVHRTDEEIADYLYVGFEELGKTQMLAEAIAPR